MYIILAQAAYRRLRGPGQAAGGTAQLPCEEREEPFFFSCVTAAARSGRSNKRGRTLLLVRRRIIHEAMPTKNERCYYYALAELLGLSERERRITVRFFFS